METYPLLITGPKGLEELLADEIRQLGLTVERATPRGVFANADSEGVNRIRLWSRLANRIHCILAKVHQADRETLYEAAAAVNWRDLLVRGGAIDIQGQGNYASLKHSGFSAQVVKDAIFDELRKVSLPTPELEPLAAVHRIQVSVGRDTYLLLNLVHESLHRRGYRLEGGAAPLKENLAAAMLMRSRWPEHYDTLLDPLCGSGTFCIEAALMATDTAPGLLGSFDTDIDPLIADEAVQNRLREEALQRRREGEKHFRKRIQGSDQSPAILKTAEENARRAGVSHLVHFQVEDATRVLPPGEPGRGLILTNPPYGERLSSDRGLSLFFSALGEHWKKHFEGWNIAILTASDETSKVLGLAPGKRNKFYNGALAVTLEHSHVRAAEERKNAVSRGLEGREASESAQMLANRLRKNARRLKPWVNREGLEAWRLYDADIPEYAVAVDIYGDRVLVQEYAAPSSIDPETARSRWLDCILTVRDELKVGEDQLFLKQRKPQKGKSQYQRLQKQGNEFEIREYDARLLVNLSDYLDTGLFLDHRPLRRRIHQEASGKRFLNLFCYTASVTVHAGLGGASSSVSVDMSQTYLDWAERNFKLNGLTPFRHKLERANVMEWLSADQRQFDLIFIDPPTFSNSKRMDGVFDVQRDQVALIEGAMKRLAPGGTLYFSNNFRRFKLAGEIASQFQVEDITQESLPPDFGRSSPAHRCWVIRSRQKA